MHRMKIRRREFLRTASAGLASFAMPHLAKAQSASGALLLISESGANSVDPHTPGANRGCYEVAWNCYDRLLSLQIEKDENGVNHANATKPAPELAEEWNESGHSITFKMRRNATFHDGAPVTSKDVKWSLDRAIAAGGNPRFQLSTGSLTDPEQSVVVDDHTFRIDYDRFFRPQHSQFRADQEERDGERPLGAGMVQKQSGRRRRLSDRQSNTGRDKLRTFR
jgi:peptide/nickel transport system substrate-binding protein